MALSAALVGNAMKSYSREPMMQSCLNRLSGRNTNSTANRGTHSGALALLPPTTTVSTGRFGLLPCRVQINIHGRCTLCGSCCTTIQALSACWLTTHSQTGHHAISVLNYIDTNSHVRVIPLARVGSACW